MDYKKAYKEAIERAKYCLTTDMDNSGHWAVKYIFPELKESEDEMMRKELIRAFESLKTIKVWNGIERSDIVAWLERQGKNSQKTPSEMLKEYFVNTPKEQIDKDWEELKHLNNIEPIIETGNKPKFKVGDWIVNNNSGGVCQVTEIKDDEYCLWPLDAEIMGYLRIIDVDNDYHLWTIRDAKDGDVLTTENFIFIFKNIDNDNGVHYYCQYEISKHEDDNQFDVALPQSLMGRVGNSIIHYSPATKEQRDFLFRKMKESGYEWDAEKKELREMEQMLKWTEKDEKCIDNCCLLIGAADDCYEKTFKDDCIHYLQSLKERIAWKPKWTDEDEKRLQSCISSIQGKGLMGGVDTINTKWLKSLKQRIKQ